MFQEKVQNDEGGIFVKSLNKKLPVKIVYYDDQGDLEDVREVLRSA